MNSSGYIKSMSINKADINKNEYYLSLPIMDYFDRKRELRFTSPITFFVGENGMGKSTLLEAIAVSYGFNPEGGSRNFTNFSVNTHSSLYEYIKLVKSAVRPKDGYFLRAESFYNVASEIERLNKIPSKRSLYDSYGGKSLHAQSHGESFMNLVINRFGGNGLYILDEPEAALSPMRQLTLLAAINDLVKNNSQFIIATHSPIMMAVPGSVVYFFSKDTIEAVNYKETPHFTLMRQFLNNPDGMLAHLLEE